MTWSASLTLFQFPLLGSVKPKEEKEITVKDFQFPLLGSMKTKTLPLSKVKTSFNSLCWVLCSGKEGGCPRPRYFQFPLLGSLENMKRIPREKLCFQFPLLGSKGDGEDDK